MPAKKKTSKAKTKRTAKPPIKAVRVIRPYLVIAKKGRGGTWREIGRYTTKNAAIAAARKASVGGYGIVSKSGRSSEKIYFEDGAMVV